MSLWHWPFFDRFEWGVSGRARARFVDYYYVNESTGSFFLFSSHLFSWCWDDQHASDWSNDIAHKMLLNVIAFFPVSLCFDADFDTIKTRSCHSPRVWILNGHVVNDFNFSKFPYTFRNYTNRPVLANVSFVLKTTSLFLSLPRKKSTKHTTNEME